MNGALGGVVRYRGRFADPMTGFESPNTLNHLAREVQASASLHFACALASLLAFAWRGATHAGPAVRSINTTPLVLLGYHPPSRQPPGFSMAISPLPPEGGAPL